MLIGKIPAQQQLQYFLYSNKMMKKVLTSPQNLRKQKYKKQTNHNLNHKSVKEGEGTSKTEEHHQSKYIYFSNQDLYGDHADEATALQQQIAQYIKKEPSADGLGFSHKTTSKNKGNYQSLNDPSMKQWSRNINPKHGVQLKNTQKVSTKPANQKLEGWVTQNSSSHHFLVDHNGNVCEIQYQVDFKKLKTIQSNPDQKTQSRPISRNSKNKQFQTQNFLKEIRLKYAKALKFRQNQLRTNQYNQKYLVESNPILIEDDLMDENMSSSNHFVKYSQRKTYLNLKKITPDANQNIRSSRNLPLKKVNMWENLEERVNHDSLIPRPSSKKRARISPGDLSVSLSNEKKVYNSVNNLSQSIRQNTVDPSQLLASKKQTKSSLEKQKKPQQGVSLKRVKATEKNKDELLQSGSSNLLGPLNHGNSKLLFKNNRPSAKSSRRTTLVKIKLKYLKSLKYGHHCHLSNIEPQNLQNAKIVPTKMNSYRTLNTETSTAEFTSKSSPKSLTHRAQGLSNRKYPLEFQRLRKLLEKQQKEPAYLICQKQIAETVNVEYQ